MAIPYAPPFTRIDQGQVVRVRVPRQSLRSLGLPVNEDRMFERVPADLLMGEDGVPRAIRFVERPPLSAGATVNGMTVLRRQFLLSVATLLPLAAQKAGKRVIVLVGPPGSGKTTQAEKLKTALDLPLICDGGDHPKRGRRGTKRLHEELGRQIAGRRPIE